MLSYWVSEYFTLGSFGCLPSPRNSDHQYAYHFFKICKNLPLLVEGIVGLKTYTYPPKVQHVSPLKSCRSLTGKACLPTTIFQRLCGTSGVCRYQIPHSNNYLQKYGTTGMQMLIVAAQAPDPWVTLWSLELITGWMKQLCF